MSDEQQLTLDTYQPSPPRFNGADYKPQRDDARLTVQYAEIFALMRDGNWRTLKEIEATTRHPQASISAQLRHARKPRFGSHTVEKEYVGDGLYRYRLIVNQPPPAPGGEVPPGNASAGATCPRSGQGDDGPENAVS